MSLPTSVWSRQVDLAIKRGGQVFTFSSNKVDAFLQPTGEKNTVEITGLYHEEVRWTNSQVSQDGGSNVHNRYSTEAYILCRKDDVFSLRWGMTVEVAKKTYRLVKSRDVEALDLFCDLVLQEVEPNGLQN